MTFLMTLMLLAQIGGDTLTGDVQGRVLDTGMLPLPGVQVTITNVDRKWRKTTTTDVNGKYAFIQLELGTYTLDFEINDYYSLTESDVPVRLRLTTAVRDVTLRRRVQTATQQITVATPEGDKDILINPAISDPNDRIITIIRERAYTALASLEDSTLRSNYNTSVVQTLPLRGGRTFDQLALFAPGVLRVPFTGGEGPAVGIGVGTAGQFAVNGLRGRSNNFTVDGSDNNDEDIGVRRQGFVSLVPQSTESIEEFQIMTSGFQADFGRNSGSMVNAVSRSGNAQHHGTIYGLLNDDLFNARRFFNQPFIDRTNSGVNNGGSYSKDDENHRQLGATAGGPIVLNKLYYFGSVERQRSTGTAVQHFVVPTADERGLRVSRSAGGFVPIAQLENFFDDRDIRYSNEAGKGVLDLYPLPNNIAGPFGPHTYSAAKRAEGKGTGFSGKGDWYFAQNQSFTARYNSTSDRSIIPFTGDAMHSSLATRTRTRNLSLFVNDMIGPRFGNMLRLSYGRTQLTFPEEGSDALIFGSAPSPRVPPAFQQIIETRYGRFGPFGSTGPIGQLSILPYSTIGIDVFNFPQGRVDNTLQIADALTWVREKHTIRAGFDFRHTQLNSFADRNSRPLLIFGYGEVSSDCVERFGCDFATPDGLLTGTDLASLAAPAGFLQALSTQPTPDSTIGLRLGQIDAFVQDAWKPHPRMVLDFGLRYDLQMITREANRRIENTFSVTPEQFSKMQPVGAFANVIRAGNSQFEKQVLGLQQFLGGREGIYDPDRNNLAPRIGFAWDARGDGQLAIRGGYTLAYDANLGAVTSQSRNVFPTFVPINLDLNFLQPTDARNRGLFLNSPTFLTFQPTQTPLIRPGTLNTYNMTGDAFSTGLGVLFGQAPASPANDQNSNGLAFTLPEKRLKTSYAQHWIFSAEQSLSPHTLASITYVGTRGLDLPRFVTPNAGRISTPILLASAVTPLQLRDFPPSTDPTSNSRPDPRLGSFLVFQNSAQSTYHSLQLTIQRRLYRSLQFRSSWTWGHAIDEVSDPFDSRAFNALPQNSNRLDLERASSNFDARHRVASYAVWSGPDKSTHRWLNHWQLAATGEFQTGQPFTVNTVIDRNLDGNLTDRVNDVSGLEFHGHSPTPIRIKNGVNPLDLIAPKRQNGGVGRNTFRADGIATIDLALSRTTTISSNRKIDIRIEAFNVFNRTHFGIPVRILESPGFGRSYDVTMDPRTVRFYARLMF